MCGRLACDLKPDQLKKCCRYQEPGKNQPVEPVWKNLYNSGKTYKPSYNICPTELAPVLLSGSHFNSDTRTIAPMIFGVIPSWSKDDATSKYSTINCRIENLNTSKLYGSLLHKGQRCIVICNGFFEWKKGGKQGNKPYFIHSKKCSDPSLNMEGTSQPSGFEPLKMAALFEKQKEEKTGNETFSFTIITRESSSEISWLHHRMPAFIDTEEQVEVWLDSQKYDGNEALLSLSPLENVVWYQVSTLVNVTSNKDMNCIKPDQEMAVSTKDKASKDFMRNWLSKKGSSRSSESLDEKKDVKRIKEEDKKS